MKRFVSLLVMSLMAALLPVGSASAAPAIAILNPSPYTATQVPEISDKGQRAVHLVAWVQEVPANALVEFEIRAVTNSLPGQNVATVDAFRAGTDTWEGFFTIPDTFPEGQYTIDARLYSNLEEVASDQQIVTMNKENVPPPAQAETIEMNQPENAGQLGFFIPKEGRPNALITASTSADAQQIRVLYTLSDPGNDPEWVECGSGPVSDGIAVARCTLAQGTNPLEVTAVAAVANMTPRPGTPNAAADDAGDSHRIVPYIQTPAAVGFDQSSITAKTRECKLITATVFDQFSRPIAAVNVDVHAEGPDDQLTFATDDRPTGVLAVSSDYQAPNDGHVSREATIRCFDPAEDSGKQQGVHRVIGTADRQHIESTTGTNNNGSFLFALYSGSQGATNVNVWADVNDDDSQSLSEAAGVASIGWDQEPPPPRRQIFIDPDGPTAEVGQCQTLTAVAREGGNALIGVNVDIHISGPDASATFCDPPGASTRRAPEQGDHVAGSHPDGTKHIEGETDTTGRFVFGVTAAGEGRMNVLAWIDESEDDNLVPAEPSAPAQVTFGVDGERTISLDASRNRVRKGRRVRLSGQIEGSDACSAGQTVKLRARPRGGRFKVIGRKQTGPDGSYVFRPRVRKTKDYQAVAPRNEPCEFARSGVETVRARN